LFYPSLPVRAQHSIPTRRSSDLIAVGDDGAERRTLRPHLLDDAAIGNLSDVPHVEDALVPAFGHSNVETGHVLMRGLRLAAEEKIGRAHVLTPVTVRSRMPSSA